MSSLQHWMCDALHGLLSFCFAFCAACLSTFSPFTCQKNGSLHEERKPLDPAWAKTSVIQLQQPPLDRPAVVGRLELFLRPR